MDAVGGNVDQNSIVSTPDELDMDQDSLYSSDEFRMYCYKVLPCSKRAAHEWTTCPWAHPGEKARRRNPKTFGYLAVPCPDTKEGKECPRGDDCPNCHSLFEYWLHPSRYRTQLCRNNDGSHCKRQICFFAHSIEELRVPDHSHLKIPEEMKQASADSAAAAAAAGSSPRAPAAASSPKAAHSSRRDSRRGSKGSISSKSLPGKDVAGSMATTTSGSLPASLELPPSPSTPTPPSVAYPVSGGSSSAPSSSTYGLLPPTPGSSSSYGRYSLDQQVLERSKSSCLAAPGTPAGALRRTTSLDVARSDAGQLSAASTPAPACSSGIVAGSSLFSSSMIADPEVPDPVHSPQSAAARQQQQQLQQQQQQHQHLMQLQKEQLEASMGAAVAYEQHMQFLMAQQQLKQQAWASSGYSSCYDYPSTGSPPLSPTPSSMVTSGSSSLNPEDSCGPYTPMGSSYASGFGPMSPGAAAWRHPHPARTLSGPAAYGPQAGVPSPAFRYQSLDSDTTAAAAAAAAASQMHSSAAEVARAQMDLMRCSPQAMAAAGAAGVPPCYSSGALAEQQQYLMGQRGGMEQQQGMGGGVEQINLTNVAELVDSVNRGELGECGNQVLTGVIGLLMQQLQQQQLTA